MRSLEIAEEVRTRTLSCARMWYWQEEKDDGWNGRRTVEGLEEEWRPSAGGRGPEDRYGHRGRGFKAKFSC